LLQDAPAENGTGSPDVLSAETVNVVLYVAVAGACVLTRIVCGVVPAAALAVIASARRRRRRADARAPCRRAYRDQAGKKIRRSLRIFVGAPP